MRESLYITMAVPLAVGAAATGVLLYALSRRWFARFERGFFLAVASAIVLTALMASALIGTWGYGAARRILSIELTAALDSIGTIVQQQIDLEVLRLNERMTGLAKAAVPALGPHGDLKDLTSSLQAVQDFNPHYLEIDLMDATGKLVASSEEDAAVRPVPDRIGTAFNLEGRTYVSEPRPSAAYRREVIYVGVPVKRSDGTVVGALGTLFDLQTSLEEVVQAARFNASGAADVIAGNGHVIADPDPRRIDRDLSSHPAVIAALQRPSGDVVAAGPDGVMRRFLFRQIKNPQTVDGRPWILLTEINEAEVVRPLLQLRDELAAGVLVMVSIGLLIAWGVSRSVTKPMDALVGVARVIETGDLTPTIPVRGQDAPGRLGTAIGNMIKGLQERDRVKDVFGRYIAKQAAERLMTGPLDLGGEAKTVTILFSDIRGFTSMAETMTPEQVVAFLNEYFTEMVDAVMEQEGMLDKFLGDGLMAVFGSFGDQPDHARRAVLAALRMKSLLAKINGDRAMRGKPPVAIGIGIHTDEVIVGNIGSRQRLEFTHIGDGVNTASRVQALNKEYHTTILVTGATFEALHGEFATTAIADVTLRGKSRSLPIYEVLSAKATAGTAQGL
jgi:class 3 adenylate cyclase